MAKKLDKYTIDNKVEMDCRRHNYETIINKTVYCSKPELGCLYISEIKSPNDMYRCMSIEKKDVWKYQK